ncbi:unnamed protein product (macronuclear) [Paramecium tetraurelia]|uniref:PX domain-containing protein n=1 Tax=Paramecium tetraurelia TaxID=5888 RepID=A0E8Y2_PARTE|nr:uncharacterized protein GSPATT00024480001 [Paramecium tetraurelia]CAK91749.1 unnamed protein product [Paramecium tetraurelia]|eukprot:XP_001459146.1 hypothetical protein (macronuclear) [Paramecium tetraurelia strain d4-2]
MQDNVLDFVITVSQSQKTEQTVYYQLNFFNQKNQLVFSNQQRYSELKKFHQALETLKITLPSFPGTHWWKSVNSDPDLIEERKQLLDQYFRSLTCSKIVRDSLIFKNFILSAQKEAEKKLLKEQREKAKKAEGLANQNKRRLKTAKYQTPATNPVNLPPTPGELKERSQSLEHKPSSCKIEKENGKGSKLQSPILNFGGSKIFRGILSNTAKQ